MGLSDAVHRRDELIRDACREASRRLASATTPDSALIATGELLFWIVAGDASMCEHRPGYQAYRNAEDCDRRGLMQGLRHPRNALAHDSEAWRPPLEDIYTDVYTGTYGTWTWADVDALPRGRSETQRKAYECRLAGRPVVTTVREALEVLEEFWTRPQAM